MKPPPNWPEGQWPTPEQWLDWFLACDRTEQLSMAAYILGKIESADSCFQQNHETLREELAAAQALRNQAIGRMDRYRLAWLSARRWRKAYRLVTTGKVEPMTG